ncbi:protein tyrosine/serine phosphatase [Novosphingobium aromaticivorans DSM 12444]|uniref:Protein tyrosine/serine phosphatase n=1 Tax=Novosphingobium aromaticivorans (strain ATCC 700278 / DSM 12444 / CCUG 56034 / CIP 105152 / NBRC 16084 / F199) TaxID=279238 RepID=Q2G3Q6_NOVAD|nr:tyrosine-protein phosphatase [Novosphingobium aromaticivorans]ABD27517.1 protein tyrosine/serine phosphatase [Novosphingobium aromaticivorans DSM 12444]SCY70872.1 protein tyrosine/serine phosphatase [Novosphingobium aromaticivorans]
MKRMLVAGLALLLSGACAPLADTGLASAPTARSVTALSQHSLHLASAPNFRDIGGYRTQDGRLVRQGIAYRSDQLDRLGDADLAAIASLRPSVVVDLRTKTERDREPDRVPAGARHLVLDVAADSTQSLGGDMRQAMAQIASGQGEALLVDANREFVTLPSARRSYATLIRLMLDSDGPVVFHCTAGKDRTGWATAVVLTLLGVPRATVMEDYLLSNARLADKNRATLAALARSGSGIDPAYLQPVLTVQPRYIEAAFDEVDHAYGSFDNYARAGLGLSDAELQRLRARFLTRAR